jgi:uncharacterized protein YndB with AHSA1/START domain
VIRIELTIEIARPADEVFDALSDVARLPEWQQSCVSSQADEPLAEGTRIRERRRVMGREIENELEVVAFDRPKRLALEARKGPVPFRVDHRLVEDEGTTVVHVNAEAKPGTFMKLAEPMMARQAEGELRGDFERLKDLLEAGGYPSSSAPVD